MANKDIALIAHLMRRAGFGASRDQLDTYMAKGYEATVEELLDPGEEQRMGDDLIRRFHPELSGMIGPLGPAENWHYRMITTSTPLQEKMALFWHGIFATGYPKVLQGKVLSDQIRMLRRYSMGSFKTLLVELAKDPAMIIWLDNQHNHKGSMNENFGRELLELFSMGVGNYTEDDIKECARAFSGWTIGNREYMEMRSQRDSDMPYGRISWHFRYDQDDHDDGEKQFLGQKGNFNGEDVIDIICQQPATARFISRHLYSFFVVDEPPVNQWAYFPPADPAAIEELSKVYFESSYDIRAMLRALFNADFFRSEESWFRKVKSPAELVAGVARLTNEFDRPRREILDRFQQSTFMGQWLTNPPSVEGWHQGSEWIDTGTMVERINFASAQLGDMNKPGVRAMVERISSNGKRTISPEALVDECLDQMGAIVVSDETRTVLNDFASMEGDLNLSAAGEGEHERKRIADVLRMVASIHEFQRS